MADSNLQIQLAARPVGLPQESDFKTHEGPVPDPGEGEVLVRTVYISLDPAMRGWMDDRPSYLPPVGLGEVMRALGVGEVVVSEHPDFRPGDRVAGTIGWQRYAVLPGKELQPLGEDVPLTLALGPLGMIGMTAYFGLLDVGKPQPGETVLTSGGAGAVGSLVGQIAKIKGCRAVGIAGGGEKCAWLTDELGLDGAVDYKAAGDAEALDRAIREACPEGVDVFFDNVGGEILDAALRRINRGARVVICGAISQYNVTEAPVGPSNYLALLVQRARMEGFIVFDYARRYGEARADLARWIGEDRIQVREHIVDGLENAPSALLRLFDGSHHGKLIVRVGPEPS